MKQEKLLLETMTCLDGIQTGFVFSTHRPGRALQNCSFFLPLYLTVHVPDKLIQQRHKLSLIPIPAAECAKVAQQQSTENQYVEVRLS